MIDPHDDKTLPLPWRRGLPNVPDWMVDAADRCPHEAARVAEAGAAIDALPKGAPALEFMALYEQMLEARDRLYAAWLATEDDGA